MYKILIVDDIEANLFSLETILKTNFNDIKIYQALDGNEALKIAMSNDIDLLISDIQMPIMDGFELAKYFKKSAKTKDIPIIFVTAIFESDEYKQKGFELGAIDYITKPIDDIVLVSKLKNYIEVYKLQKKLKKEQAYVSELLNISDEGQIIIDSYSNILDFNTKAKDIFDHIRKDITIGKLFEEENHRTDLMSVRESQEKSQEHSKLKNFINSVAIDNNATHIFKHKKKYFKIAYKQLSQNHMITLYDVTDEIKASKRDEAIFNSQNAIVVVSDGKDISNINNAFFQNFGFDSLDNFKSKHRCICELFVSKDENIPHLMPTIDGLQWNKYINQNKNKIHEAYMIDKHGNEKIYEVKASGKLFEEEEEEEEEEEVIVFNDITMIKQQTKMLEDQSRFAAMGEMISMIAHQWRQPLTTMTTIFSTMKIKKEMDMLDDKTFDESFYKINDLVQYMTKTIEDFRNFFKKQAEDESIKLDELLLKPRGFIEPSLKNYNISFDIDYKIDQNTQLILNSSKFDQVLLNLYKNSIDEFANKKMKGAQIKIECSDDEENIFIKVCDNAGGIPADIIDKIFDPYFSTKSKNGTGIGLYMSKIIIEEHMGGKLDVQNIDDSACFTIILKKQRVIGG